MRNRDAWTRLLDPWPCPAVACRVRPLARRCVYARVKTNQNLRYPYSVRVRARFQCDGDRVTGHNPQGTTTAERPRTLHKNAGAAAGTRPWSPPQACVLLLAALSAAHWVPAFESWPNAPYLRIESPLNHRRPRQSSQSRQARYGVARWCRRRSGNAAHAPDRKRPPSRRNSRSAPQAVRKSRQGNSQSPPA
jgi:hypothetical protein